MKFNRFLSVVGLLFIAAALFAGGGGQAKTGAAAADDGRYRFSMMINVNMAEPPKPDSDMLKYWRDELKADVEFIWIPNSAYNDKLAAQMAALDLPNVVTVRGPKDPLIVSAARDGLFWELDSYVDNNTEYPNLAQLNRLTLDALRIDGKIYTIPKERDIVRSGMYFRQDWLEKVGLDTPRSINDIYEMLKAFTEQDPDGNGRNDTTGLVNKGPNIGGYITAVAIYMGGDGEWYIAEDDTIRNEVDSPYYQQALDWFRDCYAKGYIMSNLPENNDDYGPFMQGRGGAVFSSVVSDAVNAQMNLSKVFPEGRVGYTMTIIRPDGKAVLPAGSGHNGGFMFPKTATRTEAELARILKFIDSTGTDKNSLVMRRGFEGKHYTVKDGKLSYTAEQFKQFAEVDFSDAGQMFPFQVKRTLPELSSDPLDQAISDDSLSFNGVLVQNQNQIYISETLIKNGTNLGNMLRDARMKYILGQLDLNGWKAVVAQWRSAGGDKVAEELTANYKASRK